MRRAFEALTKEIFDLIIIGGGIVGTGIARDAALRGIHTLLVEKEDFAYGTTSSSSRLIHGGLRYLRTLQLKLIRQDLKEREILLNIAPHLVHRLKFVIPLLRSEPLYRLTLPLALRMYDILTKGKSLPSSRCLSRQETIEIEPCLSEINGLVGSYLYYDCQSEFMERLCLENALSAAENGACILNHTTMTDLLIRDNTVYGIQVKDAFSGKSYLANGRVIINAGGPWADLVLDKLNANKKYSLRKTKGIHLFTSKISDNALVLFAKSDGRLFFVIPWKNYSLIGTTDTDYVSDLDTVHADAPSVDYLVSEMRHYFPKFTQDDIYYTIAGLRPLVATGGKTASNTSRAHKLVDHEREDGIKGFITVLGGKITAYRAIAEAASDLVCKKLALDAPCRTAYTPLPGAPDVKTQTIKQAAQKNSLSLETIAHLTAIYGSRFSSVLDYVRADKRLGQPISHGNRDILAQIKHAVEQEEALTVSDFLLRRSFLGLEPSLGIDTVETVAREMGLLLGWSNTEQQNQIESYHASAALGHCFTQ
ncbi:glycerol-3-phosphate dehydrogenase [Chloroflexota bacterium]